MASTRRLNKELHDIRSSDLESMLTVDVAEENILLWNCLLKPNCAPYNKGAFRLLIEFPAEYPFKPPKLTFKTSIYHPNIDERGQICLPIIQPDNWKPATRTDQALLALINDPDVSHALRGEIADEYQQDRKKFMKTAEELTVKHGESRS